MNVLMVVSWDNLGGVCGVVNHVATRLRDDGHGVFYLWPGSYARPRAETSREGFPAFRLNWRPTSVRGAELKSRVAFILWLPFTLVTLALLIRRLRVDLVNVHFPGSSDIHFAILRRLGVVKLITSIHGSDLLPNGTRSPSRQIGVSFLL